MKRMSIAALLATTFAVSPALAEEIAIAVHVEQSNVMYQVAQKMKEKIEEQSGGDTTVTVLGMEVGGERDQVEAAGSGEYQITLGGSVPMSLYAPKYAASDLPFVWQSSDEARKVYEGEMGDKVQKQFAANGNLHLLGLSLRNPRNLTSNEPVKTPDDVKGVRMRVPEIESWINVWSEVGALPSPIAWPEVYTSLQTGVIDMQENPVENIESAKLYEVQTYVSRTEHVYSFFHWLANNDWYTGLSDEERSMVDGAVEDAIAWGDEQVSSSEDEIIAKLEEQGMEFVEPDRDAFLAKAEPAVRKEAEKFAPEVRDYVISKLED